MSVILYFSIGILSIILLVLFDYVNNFQFYKDGDKMPGPKAYPIIGSAHLFLGMDVITTHEKLLKIAEEYASPFRGWLGNQLFIFIHDPDQIKTVLTSPQSLGKASLSRLLRPWFGNALLIAPVPMWRVHRKLIQPAFNFQILRKFVHIFDEHAKLMVKKMEEELDRGEFEVRSYLIPFALNVALETSMGLSKNSDLNISGEFGVCVDRAFELTMKRGFRPWLHPDKIFNLTKMSKDFYRSVKEMHRVTHAIIAKKKHEFEKHGKAKKDEIENQREGFLELLLDLQDKQKFSDQQICDEVNFMVMAAYDTVSISLQFVLLMLAYHPDVQEKAYQELRHIYGDVNPENVLITSDDLREMKYTERIFQESLRLFPSVAFVLRKIEEDLHVGGYKLPKGCTAFCSIAKIQRDEKYWTDPLKFDPDRFLPEEVAKRNPYCYLPFSGGPRNCIGSLHAIMEMKTALTRILLKFIVRKKHIEPIKNIKQRGEIVSHPLEPVKIEIVRRLPKTSAYEKLLEIAEEYASPFRGWLGNQLFIVIHEPDQMKTVLTSPKSMGKALSRLLRPWLGNALLVAPVPMWRVHRKLIQPAFNFQILRKFVHIFDEHAKSMVKKMEEELDGAEFEIRSYLIPFALNVALETSMGLSKNSDLNINGELGVCVDRAFELAMKRGFRPWLHPDKIFNLTKMSKDFYRSIKEMHRVSHAIIAKKKREFEKHGIAKKDEIENQRGGFLELLLDLQDKQKFSDQQICDEVNFMVIAAYNTVSVALQFVLLMLAYHPDVQEKLYDEMKHIYGDVIPENVLITSDDLREMKYTERIIQESLRLFPSIAFVLRKIEEDLHVGGYTLPKGCTAFCYIAKIHRDEKYWPDPLKFDPDRFLPEEVAKRNPYCYLPFSGGPRNCIGSSLAIMEMKTALTRIFLKFIVRKKHIEPIKNIRQKPEVVSHPLEPIKIEIDEEKDTRALSLGFSRSSKTMAYDHSFTTRRANMDLPPPPNL
ncbi:uncharacterized protein LOC117180645 [Belonocnema kinseyi]|uniref:uncharacterized protein LOC117180645 n=1 Tax=Belonocnema kinseyi TaxID=2817044 RepID=UPI00143DF661|nr:uncharacterized protein LOC117180645 [Belonocnema kinseyi]